MPRNTTVAKLVSIQYLRAIAAIGVVAYHSSSALFNRQSGLVDLEFGAYGVDLFFVVSGFIMSYIMLTGAHAPGEFFVRRLIRIVPLFFLLTTLTFALAWASPGRFETASTDLSLYVTSIFFIPHYNPLLHCIQPLLGQGWTLNYEMFFYVLFAIGLVFPKKHQLSIVTSMIVVCGALSCLYRGHNIFVLTYTNPLSLEFCFGMWICCMFTRKAGLRRPQVFVAAALGAILVALIAASYLTEPGQFVKATSDGLLGGGWRFLLVGIPSALVMAAALSIESAGRLPFRKTFYLIGEASYSLYLGHTFVLAVFRRIWQHLFDVATVASHGAFIGAATASSILVGVALFITVERPITNYLTRMVLRPTLVAGPTFTGCMPLARHLRQAFLLSLQWTPLQRPSSGLKE